MGGKKIVRYQNNCNLVIIDKHVPAYFTVFPKYQIGLITPRKNNSYDCALSKHYLSSFVFYQVMYMYYLLGFRILAQPENLLIKEEADDNNVEDDFQRVKLTNSQLRKRRKAAHFTRSVIFNYITDEVHTQV